MSNYTLDVQMTPEHIDRNAKVSPKEAIKELIWNSCDADATQVDISLAMNYLGDEIGAIEKIIVKDNGHGIKHEEMPNLFGFYGRSNKTYSPKSPQGRIFHGKQGQGRYKSFSIGSFVKWESVYKDDNGQKYRFEVDFNSLSKTKCPYSERVPVEQNTPTGVTVTISGILDNVSVLADWLIMKEELISSFAPYLLAYKDIVICYDSHVLVPDDFIQEHEEILIDFEKDGVKREGRVKLILWKNSPGKILYICGESGATFDALSVNTKNHPVSAYVISDLFDEMQQNNTLALGPLDPHYDAFISQAKKAVKNFVNTRFYTDAVEEVKTIKETDIYPYEGDSQSKLDTAEREIFDLLAVEVNSIVPTFRKSSKETKKLTYRLIKEAVKTKPNSLTTILTEVFRLSSEDQDKLAELLDHTNLSSIINMTQTISDRLLFIHALEQMVYNKEVGKEIKERKQFHKILLNELWVFGEKYALGASDLSLKNVLTKYLSYLERNDLTPEIPDEAANDATLIPDLCLWKQYPIQDERLENLIIELKRPTKRLGKKELDQIETYAFAISADPQFPKENTKWNFLLLGHDFDDYVIRKLEDKKSGVGNLYNSEDGTVSVSVLQWNKVIQENKLRFNFLKERLDYSLEASQQALDYLHIKYASLFEVKK